MSINSFTDPQKYDWKKVYFKNVNTDNIDCSTINNLPVPSGGGGTPTDIIYRDGAPSSGNLYGSWADVLSVCNANSQFVNVCIDSSDGQCIASVSHDFQGRTSFYSRNLSNPNESTLRIADTVVLSNIRSLNGTVQLLGINPSGINSLKFDGQNDFFMNDWSSLNHHASSGGPMIDISNGAEINLQLTNQSYFVPASIPYINIGIGSTLGISLFNASSIASDSITSTDASGILNVYSDASSAFLLPQTGYLGTPSITLADSSTNIDYTNNVLISPINLNALNAQESVDSLKNMTKSIIYRPGGTASRNVFTSWAQIVSLLNKNNSILDIYFDDSLLSPCPIDVSYDFKGGVTFNTINNNPAVNTKVQIANGTQIQNLKGIYGMITLTSDNADGQPTLLWDPNKFFEVSYATLDNSIGSTGPYINVSTTWQFSIYNRASLKATGGHPIAISVGAGAQMAMSSVVGCDIQSNCISGTPTSILYLVNDASQVAQTQAVSFPVGLTTNNIDKAEYVSYNDAYQNPPLGVNIDTVQKAIDVLKQQTPLQLVSFRAIVGTGLTNKTGDLSIYQVVFGTENYDPFNVYNNTTGVFTAPVNGFYLFTSNVLINNLSIGHTIATYKLVKNTNVYLDETNFNPYVIAVGGLSTNMRVSTMGYLNQNDTVACELVVGNSTLTVGIAGVSPNLAYSSFCCKQLA